MYAQLCRVNGHLTLFGEKVTLKTAAYTVANHLAITCY